MHDPLCPSLYQINTRVWLTELSRALGRPATLDDIPDAELDRLAASTTVFRGLADTLQLDYSNPATQEAMVGELLRIAEPV